MIGGKAAAGVLITTGLVVVLTITGVFEVLTTTELFEARATTVGALVEESFLRRLAIGFTGTELVLACVVAVFDVAALLEAASSVACSALSRASCLAESVSFEPGDCAQAVRPVSSRVRAMVFTVFLR